MNLITSNINLMSSNIRWGKLKIKSTIDPTYNNFYLALMNEETIDKYSSIHNIIYLNSKNYIEELKKINSLKKNLKKNFTKQFFFYFFLDPDLKKKNILINKKINLLSSNTSNIYIDNFYEKINKSFFDKRNFKFLKFPFDLNSIIFISKIILNKIKLINSKPYKLIILDCDNTLWGGILDEDKIHNLKYSKDAKGKMFENFQTKLKELKKKGFLLAICSKNNENKVWECMQKRRMILQKNDFIISRINWNEKSKNINSIVKLLGLRVNDCIFIDDNIVEINKVKDSLKDINTFHLKEISDYAKLFENDYRLHKLKLTSEDKKKYKQYKLRSKFSDYVNYNKITPKIIKNLKQKVNLYNCKKKYIKRCEQLFNKTNQFNFSLNRYKEKDLIFFSKNDKYDLKLFDLKDRFGDHGIIGAYLLKKEKNKILICDFLLSCRVLYRFVEDLIIFKIMEKYKNHKCEIIYFKTKVNSSLIPKFLKKNIFSFINKKNNYYYYNLNYKKDKINEIKKIFNN